MKSHIAIGILTFAAGILAARQFIRPEVRTEIKEVKVKEVVTVVKRVETRRPDGTVIIETDTRKDSKSESKKTAKAEVPQWSVGAYVNARKDHYVLTIDRRLHGPVFIGVYGGYDQRSGDITGGLGIRIEF